jgi:hypothetical protein
VAHHGGEARGARVLALDVADRRAVDALADREHVVEVAADHARARQVARGEVEALDRGQPRGQEALLQHTLRSPSSSNLQTSPRPKNRPPSTSPARDFTGTAR